MRLNERPLMVHGGGGGGGGGVGEGGGGGSGALEGVTGSLPSTRLSVRLSVGRVAVRTAAIVLPTSVHVCMEESFMLESDPQGDFISAHHETTI